MISKTLVRLTGRMKGFKENNPVGLGIHEFDEFMFAAWSPGEGCNSGDRYLLLSTVPPMSPLAECLLSSAGVETLCLYTYSSS